jgi:protein SCO1/2
MPDSGSQKTKAGFPLSFKVLAVGISVFAAILAIAFTNSKPVDNGSWYGKNLTPPREAYSFELTDQNGEKFRLADQRGKVILLYFGFTNCPNICPTSLSNLSAAIRLLPHQARERVNVVFISVDENDDIAALKKYMPLFDEKFTGLTGAKEVIGTIARAYGAFYRKSETQEDLIDHSTNTCLIDSDGRMRLVYGIDQLPNAAAIASDILRILGMPVFQP